MADYQYEYKDWKKFPPENLLFILNEGEKRLIQTVILSDKITSRAITFQAVLIPIFSLLIGTLIRNSPQNDLILTITCLVLLLPCCFCLYMLASLTAFPFELSRIGSPPSYLLSSEWIENYDTYTPDEQYKLTILGQIDNIQTKINENENVTNARIKKFTRTSWCLVITLIASVTWLLIKFGFTL